MQRAAAGDREVAALLDDRYRRRLTRYARSLLGRSHHDAEDVVQDVLVKANVELAAGRGAEHLDAWMFRLTRNRAIDEMRRARWGEASLDAAPDGGEAITARATQDGDGDAAAGGRAAADPAAVLHRRESLRSLVQDLADLPVAQREALLVRVVDGATPQESAEQLGVSVEAVQMLVVRGRANLVRIRDLRQATGDLDRQLRLLAPPIGIVPALGLAKLIAFGGTKVVAVVAAGLAVVATATGIEVVRTQQAAAGDPAPFALNLHQTADEFFDHSVRRGQPIPPGNAVLAATVRFPAGPDHAKGRTATLQCPTGFQPASILNYGVPDYHPPVEILSTGQVIHNTTPANLSRDPKGLPRPDSKITLRFADTVLAKPTTMRIRILCRKPGIGGSLMLHPRVPGPGEGAGYICGGAEVFLYPNRIIVATLERGRYVTLLRRQGPYAFVIAPFNQRGWIKTKLLCRGYTLPKKKATGPPLFPVGELGYPRGAKGFRPASDAKWLKR